MLISAQCFEITAKEVSRFMLISNNAADKGALPIKEILTIYEINQPGFAEM
jgi:hypothetical protein